jgi:hypothetical protein
MDDSVISLPHPITAFRCALSSLLGMGLIAQLKQMFIFVRYYAPQNPDSFEIQYEEGRYLSHKVVQNQHVL